MFYYYGIDYTYIIFVLPAVILAMFAQIKVNSAFNKYSKIPSDGGMTGADAARMVLSAHGIYDVSVVEVKGKLTDHFDPRDNTIRLSESVYGARSAAAVGVAAHEAGHAVQFAEGYVPMQLRSAIIPLTRIGSNLAFPLALLGIVFSFAPLAYAGVVLYGAAVLFQLVTLPVEFNASRRALVSIEDSGRFTDEGKRAARKVLSAAAMTYVAALFVALGNMLRLLAIVGRSRRD